MSINNEDKDTVVVATKYEQDGQEAHEIAKYLPYFPFKGIPRFYDIGGFLAEPSIFQKIVDIFVDRYREIGIDSIAGYVLVIVVVVVALWLSSPIFLTLASFHHHPTYYTDWMPAALSWDHQLHWHSRNHLS